MSNKAVRVVVSRVVPLNDEISQFELIGHDGQLLPAFSAGAHVDVHLEGFVRQYSLCNCPSERHRYVLAVKREEAGLGGSVAMHQQVTAGKCLEISEPRNNFQLVKTSACSYLLAGGIGITPMLSMAYQLHRDNSPFELHYCCRSQQQAAFAAQLGDSEFSDRVFIHCDDQDDTQKLDVKALLQARAADNHLYVCGPQAFMDFVIGAARDQYGWPESAIHREYFKAPAVAHDGDQPFEVRLSRSGQSFVISAEQSIMEVLQAAGVDIPVSCEQGICGTCLTPVVAGEPDHRDLYMTDAEHAANNYITPCCSRSKSPVLTLDI